MDKANAFFGTLGLAMRSGQVVIGEPKTKVLVSGSQAALVLIDAAASANTVKTVLDKCRYYGVPAATVAGGRLGQAVGRPACMIAGVVKGGLGDLLYKKVVENEFDDIQLELNDGQTQANL
ncbi:MAG: ribosomal L7Ae/L30e/S12e/Gadd45 family protein [Clostridia bacterium]|nr:ribosomal L7Ae/L30e/S12e/Gadd45 family protein [Clostridia bacterium]